jgi:hypothetical protein
MSLRLGRASPIQIYDISLPTPDEDADIPYPWAPVCMWWTRSAIIQSEVYKYLYSPEALQKPESERVTHAYRLAAEMKSTVMEPFEVCSVNFVRLSLFANMIHVEIHVVRTQYIPGRSHVPHN